MARRSALPGFGLTMGITLTYLSLLVFLPLTALLLKGISQTWESFAAAAFHPRVLASYRLTFGAAFLAALVNTILGFLVAWCLVRYRFPGRKLIDAFIDLPFAIPTAVSGIALTSIYARNGWIGRYLESVGLEVAFRPLGICLAMVFISFPYVIRTLQPALEELDREQEEAAACLGASPWQIVFRVLLPTVAPAIVTGFSLAFARSLGEYGSVVFISGNMPYKTEITSLMIITKLEQHDLLGASSIATVMLLSSLLLLLAIHAFQWRMARHSVQ
ncbi:MAG: sulfate ABC transporter permease subunit CysT [Pirellulaceae bacterium]|jgi:sulfate transport system permease protein